MDDFEKAKLAKTMDVYDPNRRCPKCQGEEVRSFYNKGHDCGHPACTSAHPEHQLRTCQRCFYQWMESIPEETLERPKTQAELDQMPSITCKCGRQIYLDVPATPQEKVRTDG